MELIFICLVIMAGAISIAGPLTRDAKMQEIRDTLREVQRFLAYVEENKSSLPPDIRERFDELDKFCEKQKEA